MGWWSDFKNVVRGTFDSTYVPPENRAPAPQTQAERDAEMRRLNESSKNLQGMTNAADAVLEKAKQAEEAAKKLWQETQEYAEVVYATMDSTYTMSKYRETADQTRQRAGANWEKENPGKKFSELPREQQNKITMGQVKADGASYDAKFKDVANVVNKVNKTLEDIRDLGEAAYSVVDNTYVLSKNRESAEQTRQRAARNYNNDPANWDKPKFETLSREEQNKMTMDQVKEDGAKYLEHFKTIEKTMVTGVKMVANYALPYAGGVIVDAALGMADKHELLKAYPDGMRSGDIGSTNKALTQLVDATQLAARGKGDEAMAELKKIKTDDLAMLVVEIAASGKGGGKGLSNVQGAVAKDGLKAMEKDALKKLTTETIKSGDKEALKLLLREAEKQGVKEVREEVEKRAMMPLLQKGEELAMDYVKKKVKGEVKSQAKDFLKDQGKKLAASGQQYLAEQYPELAPIIKGEITQAELKQIAAIAFPEMASMDPKAFMARITGGDITLESSVKALEERAQVVDGFIKAKIANVSLSSGGSKSLTPDEIKQLRADAMKMPMDKLLTEAKQVMQANENIVLETKQEQQKVQAEAKGKLVEAYVTAKKALTEISTVPPTVVTPEMENKMREEATAMDAKALADKVQATATALKLEQEKAAATSKDPNNKNKDVGQLTDQARGGPGAVKRGTDWVEEKIKEAQTDAKEATRGQDLEKQRLEMWDKRLDKATKALEELKKDGISPNEKRQATENAVMIREALTTKMNAETDPTMKAVLKKRLDENQKFMDDNKLDPRSLAEPEPQPVQPEQPPMNEQETERLLKEQMAIVEQYMNPKVPLALVEEQAAMDAIIAADKLLQQQLEASTAAIAAAKNDEDKLMLENMQVTNLMRMAELEKAAEQISKQAEADIKAVMEAAAKGDVPPEMLAKAEKATKVLDAYIKREQDQLASQPGGLESDDMAKLIEKQEQNAKVAKSLKDMEEAQKRGTTEKPKPQPEAGSPTPPSKDDMRKNIVQLIGNLLGIDVTAMLKEIDKGKQTQNPPVVDDKQKPQNPPVVDDKQKPQNPPVVDDKQKPQTPPEGSVKDNMAAIRKAAEDQVRASNNDKKPNEPLTPEEQQQAMNKAKEALKKVQGKISGGMSAKQATAEVAKEMRESADAAQKTKDEINATKGPKKEEPVKTNGKDEVLKDGVRKDSVMAKLLDGNNDGKVTREEVEAAFKKIAGENGKIDRGEIRKAAQEAGIKGKPGEMRETIQLLMKEGDPKGKEQAEKASQTVKPKVDAMIKAMDGALGQKDGKTTADEMIKALDKNGDKKVDGREVAAALKEQGIKAGSEMSAALKQVREAMEKAGVKFDGGKGSIEAGPQSGPKGKTTETRGI